MSQYTLVWHEDAQKQLEKLKHDKVRILKKLDDTVKDPYQYLRRLSGYPYYKIRVGNYRIILKVMEDKQKLYILFVGHRSKAYKSLNSLHKLLP